MVSTRVILAALAIIHGCLAGQFYRHDHDEVIPGEYMVVLKPGADGRGLLQVEETIRRLTGITIDRRMTIGKRPFLKVKADEAKIAKLVSLSSVDFIESNQRSFLIEPVEKFPASPRKQSAAMNAASNAHAACVTDPLNGDDSWGLIRTTQHSKPDYNSEYYHWGEGDDGTGVDIYIFDTGIDLNHAEFEGRATWGFTGPDIQNKNEEDIHGHGTHVAGTAGGSNYGVARNANLIAVQVLGDEGSGTFSDIVEAIEYVITQVQLQRSQGKVPRAVINMSLSGTGTAYAAESAIQAAHDEGVLSVVAAGNNANDTCMQTPARIGAALTVAASNINDTLAWFSNYGPCTDIIAPGRYIMGPEAGTNQYVKFSGTSMASPHVAGMVARHLSVLSDYKLSHTSSDMLKAALFDQASTGQIDLYNTEHMATPNHLLYKQCESPMAEPSSTTTTPAAATTTTVANPTGATTPPTNPPSTTSPSQADGYSMDNIYDMSLASLILSALVLCGSLDAIILMYCAISNKKT